MTKPHIVILGAGPAGVGAAWQLTRQNKAKVTVLERNPGVGGNAGSFDLAGQRVDYGSHRLHPASDPQVLHDIKTLLGDDLLDRPRHGRIRLRGRWIHFPLKPLDLALRLPPSFALGVAADSAGKMLNGQQPDEVEENFATVLEAGLGRTICRDFYFPYARKLWGMEPTELSAIQARRRVSAGSLGKMVRKVLAAVPGLKPAGAGRFFYPRRGFGQISEAYHQAAIESGADFQFGASVRGVELLSNGSQHTVRFEQAGQSRSLQADYVWSTIPITGLARGLTPAPPPEYVQAANSIDYRAMILIYLALDQPQFSEYDAHYFPETEIAISRMSEPKNYRGGRDGSDVTVLCAELPCAPTDAVWSQSDEELGRLMRRSLEIAGLPLRAEVKQVVTRRLPQAYPIYPQGYETHFDRLDEWVEGLEGLLSFGRQGLFAHDNTHHALFMAYSAVNCLDEQGRFDRVRWQEYRQIFKTHVVED